MKADVSIRRLIDNAAGAADDLTKALLEYGDGPLTKGAWLNVLAESGSAEARMHRAMDKVSVRLGLPRGAKPRILEYLRANEGRVVDKDQLAGVAGISEWARRVRELRVEDGWQISSATSRDDLKPGEYRLEALEPDEGLAARWKAANEIRRRPGGAKARLLSYLQANVGTPLSKDELQYVARIHEHARRIRELSEDGWQIESNLDLPSLAPGQYVLVSAAQLAPRARQAIKLRYQILDRDGYRCLSCGANQGHGRRLQVHHTLPVKDQGTNDPNNLETLCDVCHAGRHALLASAVDDELVRPDLERPLA
jgi:hypothetical protein